MNPLASPVSPDQTTRLAACALLARRGPVGCRRRPAIACEWLEGRTLFALTITPFTDPDSGAAGLRITGDSSNETLNVVEEPGLATVELNGTGIPGIQSFGEIELWDIRTGGGDDAVNWLVFGQYDGDNRSVFVDTGAGNDRFAYDAGEVANSSTLLFDVQGGPGNDFLLASAPAGVTSASRFNVQVDAGDGNDSVRGFVSVVTGGSQFDMDVQLGSGANEFRYQTQGIAADASAVFNIQGGDSTGTQFDDVTVSAFESTDGELAVNAALGAGNDRATVEFGRDGDLSTGLSARVNLRGQAGNDTLAVRTNQTDNFRAVDGVLDITQAGGAGNDTLTVDLRRTTVTGDTDGLDLDGRLRLRQHGQGGNDTLNTDLLFIGGSTGIADVIVTGDAGNDRATFALRDRSSGAVDYVGGFALLDGGADFDTRAGIVTNVRSRLRVQRLDAGAGVVVVVL